jgi:hypothetical protein
MNVRLDLSHEGRKQIEGVGEYLDLRGRMEKTALRGAS